MDVDISRMAHLHDGWLGHGEYAPQGVRGVADLSSIQIRIRGRTDYSYL